MSRRRRGVRGPCRCPVRRGRLAGLGRRLAERLGGQSTSRLLVRCDVVDGRGFARGAGLGDFLFRISRFDASRPWAILIGAGLVLALCVVEGIRLEVDSSGPNAFAEDAPFRVSSEFYRESLSGDVIENVYLMGAKEGDFKDPARLRRMLEFQAAAEMLPQIDKSISIANYIALMNRAMHENRESEERIPDSRDAVAQYLLLYSFSGDLEEFDDLKDIFLEIVLEPCC